MVISLDVTTACCLKIKWNNFVRRSHEKWFIVASNSENQTATDFKLSLMEYKWLFHLMLRLYVASKSNEITLFGPYMKSDLLPTGIMLETPTIKQQLTFN